MAKNQTHVEVAGQTVRVSSPDKVVFPRQGWTKMDIVRHYLRVADGAVRGIFGRPSNLKRWPKTSGSRGLHIYVRLAPRRPRRNLTTWVQSRLCYRFAT